MNERVRERVYFVFALACLAVSPLLLFAATESRLAPAWDPYRFTTVLLLSIPAPLIPELLANALRGKLRFWFKVPAVRCENSVEMDLPTCSSLIRQRIESLGFTWSPLLADTIQLSKKGLKATHGFLDHGFAGQLVLARCGANTLVRLELSLETTVVIETDESAKLRSLCEYVCLQTQETSVRGVEWFVYSGVWLAFATVFLAALAAGFPAVVPWLFASATGCAGMLAIGLVNLVRFPRDVFGLRLMASGLVLSALPWLRAFLANGVGG